jgi:hypothetical protein
LFLLPFAATDLGIGDLDPTWKKRYGDRQWMCICKPTGIW